MGDGMTGARTPARSTSRRVPSVRSLILSRLRIGRSRRSLRVGVRRPLSALAILSALSTLSPLPSALLSVLPSFRPRPLAAQSLTKRLDRRLDAPPMDRNLWGVALVDEKGKLLYGRNPRQLFIPASNTKIVVAAVASALLAPDWTVRTSLY